MRKNPQVIPAAIVSLSLIFYAPIPVRAELPPIPVQTTAAPVIDALTSDPDSTTAPSPRTVTTTDFLLQDAPLSLAEEPCTTAMCGVTAGQTVSGTIFVQPNLTLEPTVRKVFYYLNGAQSGKYYAAPFTWGGSAGFNTALVPDGNYTLSGLYTTSTGDKYFSIAFTVNNSSQPPDLVAPVISAVGSSNITATGAAITWTTDEASDSQVQYRVQGSATWLNTTLNASLVTSHSVALTGLAPDTVYEFQTKSKDAAGNLAIQTTISTFTTALPDTTLPVISAVTANNITASGATITWTTDEASDSQVQYRVQGSATWLNTTLNASLVTSHSVALSGLVAGTVYEYQVKSRDASGNLATQATISSLTTAAVPAGDFVGVTPGAVVSGVVAIGPNLLLHPSVRKVSYYLNGTKSGKVYASPYLWGGPSGDGTAGFDTRTLADGNYTLSMGYTDDTGDHSASIAFGVNNSVDTTAPVISAVGSANVTATGATITWTTDEPSDSQVQYRVQGSASWLNTTLAVSLVTSHSVALTGLAPDTVYEFQTKSKDAAGNLATQAAIATFTTMAPDTTLPVISAVTANNITASGATITWTTDEVSDSQVQYRVQGAAIWLDTTLDAALVTSHAVTLAGLGSSTSYEYQVKSRDPSGNLATQVTSANFTTGAASIPPATLLTPAGRVLGGLQFPSGTTSFADIDQAGVLSFLAGGQALSIVSSADPALAQVFSVLTFETPILDIQAAPDGTAVFILEHGAMKSPTHRRSRLWRADLTNPAAPVLELKDEISIFDSASTGTRLTVFEDPVNGPQVQLYFMSEGENFVETCPVAGGACSRSFSASYLSTDLVYRYGDWVMATYAGSSNVELNFLPLDFSLTPTAAPIAFMSGQANHLFVSLKNGTLAIYDVDQVDPVTGQIPVVRTIDAQGNDPIFNLIFGDRLAVLDSTGLIEIFDITDPLNPVPVDSVNAPGTERLDLDGDHLYVVAEDQYRVLMSPDTGAPVISAVASTRVTSAGATLTWTTDEPGDSQVQYRGLGNTTWLNSGLDPALVTSHSVQLILLSGSRTYEFRVLSKDEAGNLTQSPVSTFTTLVRPTTAPVYMLGDSITAWTDWEANLDRNDVINGGVAGERTDQILARLPQVYDALPEIVFMMGGINDLRAGYSVDFAYNNYLQILDGLIAHGIRPVIQSTIHVRESEVTANQKVTELNTRLQAYAVTAGLDFVDLDATFSENGHIKPEYTTDGVHLSTEAYELWKIEVLAVLERYAADTTPPVISAVTSSGVSSTGATIQWTTDEAGDSQVEYRVQGAANWLTTALDAVLVTNHSVTLSGLAPGTVYEYRVRSKDASGNLATQATPSILTTPVLVSEDGYFLGVRSGATLDGAIDIRINPASGLAIQKVSYYLNGTQIGKVYAPPYAFGITHLNDGVYTLAGAITVYGQGDLYFSYTFTVHNSIPETTPIFMLGDSITAWTDWEANLGRTDVVNGGIGGDRTDQFLARIQQVYDTSPEIVFVMGGINDILQGYSVDHAYGYYVQILEGLIAHGIRPVIQSTLYVSEDRSAENLKVTDLNARLRTYAQANGIDFMDLNALLSENGHIKPQYTSDGIHLSSAAYDIWEVEILAVLATYGI